MKVKTVNLAAALTLIVAAAPAQAVVIPFSSVVTPTSPIVNGLEGRFADVPSVTSADELFAGLAIADSSPTATFVSTLIDYPNGAADTVADATTLSTYLGADAGSLSGAGATTMEGSVFVYEGLIDIADAFDTDAGTPTIDINFNVGSDDGFRLFIGGILVNECFCNRPFGFTPGLAEFEAAGLYDLRLEQWENFGGTGVEFYSSIPGGPDSGAPAGTVGIVPTSVLFHRVPAPATLLLVSLGLVGLGFTKRTRHI